MAKFVPTQEQLDRWATIPMTFGTTKAVKAALNRLGDYSKLDMPQSYRDRLDHLTKRSDKGQWINLFDANRGGAQMTQLQAHNLIEWVDTLVNQGVTVAQTEPVKPVTEPVKPVTAQAVTFKDGDIIIVNGESVRISVNGKRFYLAKV